MSCYFRSVVPSSGGLGGQKPNGRAPDMNSAHKVAREICMGFPHQCSQWNGAPKHSGGGWKQGSPARRNEHGAFGLRPGPRTPGRWGCGGWPQKVRHARARSSPHVDSARGQGLARSAAVYFRGARYPGPRWRFYCLKQSRKLLELFFPGHL